jgi:type II secretory pathway component PulM
MSGRAAIMASLALLIASACILGVAFARWHSASDNLDRAKAELVSVQQQATEIRSLQATLDTQRIATTGSRADALAEIADTLAAAGLPESAMRSLDEQSDAEVGDAGQRRQTLRLAITTITPGELGRFLARLEADHPEWGVTRVELTRPRRGDGNRYDAGLTLSRTYDASARSQGDSRP